MAVDGLALCEEDIDAVEKRVEEWGNSRTSVVLTNDEWCLLTFYLTVSDKYIQRDIEIYQGILKAEELNGEQYKEISDKVSYLEGLLKSVAAMDKRISEEFTQNSMKNKGA